MEPISSSDRRIPWWSGIVTFFLVVALLFLFYIVLRAAMIMLNPEDVLDWARSPAGMTLQVVFMSVLFAGLAFAVPALWKLSPREWLCLSPVRPVVYGVSVLGVLGLGFLVDETVYLLHRFDPAFFSPAGLDLFNQMFVSVSPATFAVLTIVVALGPGIGEELFFRGLMLRSLLTTGRATAAVTLSALFFGLIHFDVLQSPGAALIGAYLGVVALRANSLYPAMAAHAANNLLCAMFARFADAEGMNPVLEGHPPWLLMTAGSVFLVSLWGLLLSTRRSVSASD